MLSYVFPTQRERKTNIEAEDRMTADPIICISLVVRIN